MTWHRLICLAALAGQLLGSGMAADRVAADPASDAPKQAPVLRPLEPPDSGQITLPGPAPVSAPAPPPAATKKIDAVVPAAKLAPAPGSQIESAKLRSPAPAPTTVPTAVPVKQVAATVTSVAPMVRTAPIPKPAPPSPFGPEVSAYCQKQIGHWKEADARKSLGDPIRHRPAYDEKRTVNGTIYAFKDPTSKYKELELDFDAKTGELRTVFVYPPRLTWQDCKRIWTGPVAAADAAQGRKFYSYTNRRLDVLVDPAGKVISLGWY